MSKELDHLIHKARKLQDSMPSVPGGPPRSFTKAVREALDYRRKVRETADDQLSPDDLVMKQKDVAEEDRLLKKFGHDWDRIFGK